MSVNSQLDVGCLSANSGITGICLSGHSTVLEAAGRMSIVTYLSANNNNITVQWFSNSPVMGLGSSSSQW